MYWYWLHYPVCHEEVASQLRACRGGFNISNSFSGESVTIICPHSAYSKNVYKTNCSALRRIHRQKKLLVAHKQKPTTETWGSRSTEKSRLTWPGQSNANCLVVNITHNAVVQSYIQNHMIVLSLGLHCLQTIRTRSLTQTHRWITSAVFLKKTWTIRAFILRGWVVTLSGSSFHTNSA